MTTNGDYLKVGRQVLNDEVQDLQTLSAQLDSSFDQACRLIDDCAGRVIFIGIGHSGHVAAKSASSFNSLGIHAFFLHAAEAVHGELGAVTGQDVCILISNSGETDEVLALLPRIHAVGAKSISIVGKPHSSLAKGCDVGLSTAFQQEAGPLKFAGSSSALLAMALCDALAMAVAHARGLTAEDYAQHHPGGAVGKQLREDLA
ncbi:MAG: arabinose-5-phosphate isomerase [Chloroflexota bacterium]|nr:arabinose-5-phosphate isomerase [Chloroflexota bacterium]